MMFVRLSALWNASISFDNKTEWSLYPFNNMMTSSNGNTFYALLALCARNSPVTGEFPAHWPVTRSFDVFYDLRLNKRLRKQSWCWWFETPSFSLWRYCNGDILRSGPNDCHFADDFLKLIFLYEICGLLLIMSLKLIHNGPIEINPG